jgi:hypothetical protein
MRALFLYDSVSGNTEQVARAVAGALGSPPEVVLSRVGSLTPAQLAGVDLLIAGAPTHSFRPTPALTGFLKGLPPNSLRGVKVAAFDTRIPADELVRLIKAPLARVVVRLGGYAARPIANLLAKKGGVLIAPPEGFLVAGQEGPLEAGELPRAAEWARRCRAACEVG